MRGDTLGEQEEKGLLRIGAWVTVRILLLTCTPYGNSKGLICPEVDLVVTRRFLHDVSSVQVCISAGQMYLSHAMVSKAVAFEQYR